MTDYEQTHDAVNDLLEAAYRMGWSVEHYQIDSDAYGMAELSLELERQPKKKEIGIFETGNPKQQRDRIQAIKEVIVEREQKNDLGAEVSAVINEVSNWDGVDKETVKNVLERLKQQGEIYEPTTDHIRIT